MGNRTMLTIDWDYFVPEDISWDLAHRESLFMITDAWSVRCVGSNLKNKMKTSGEETGFWKKWESIFGFNANTRLMITESHAEAYVIAADLGINRIISFDAHMDLGYGHHSYGLEPLDCGSWLAYLLTEGRLDRADIILSEATNEKIPQVRHMTSNYNVNIFKADEYFSRIANKLNIKAVHICRSGAWTPPWLDKKFNKFCIASGLRPEYSTVIPREFDTKGVREATKNMEKLKKLNS